MDDDIVYEYLRNKYFILPQSSVSNNQIQIGRLGFRAVWEPPWGHTRAVLLRARQERGP